MLLVTHRQPANVDKVLVLQQGRVVMFGETGEVVRFLASRREATHGIGGISAPEATRQR